MRAHGVKWDLFLEYLLEALAAGLVGAAGWLGRKAWRRYRKWLARRKREVGRGR